MPLASWPKRTAVSTGMSLAVWGTVLRLGTAPTLVQLLAGVVVGVPAYAVAALWLARPQVESALALVRDRKAVTA